MLTIILMYKNVDINLYKILKYLIFYKNF